jgi:ribokinase
MIANIWVDNSGENRIIIVPGANHEIEAKTVVKAIGEISSKIACVIGQCEIEESVTVAAFRAAKSMGAITILNPAPYCLLSNELLELTDWLVPNESEFSSMHPDGLQVRG